MTRLDGPLGELPPRLRAAVEKGLRADNDRKARRRTTSAALTAPQPGPEPRPVTVDPFTLDVPIPVWSLNQDTSQHWRGRAERTNAMRRAVCLLVPRVQGRYVELVEIECTPRRVRHDPGNSYSAAKAAIDGLVDAGVLADDTKDQVARIILNAPVGGEPGMLLTVRPFVV